jgi:microcystin-dependent protein
VGYDRGTQDLLKSTGQLAYEAAVELLGCRNPTTSTTTSASSAAAAASTATSIAATAASADLGMLANRAVGEVHAHTYIRTYIDLSFLCSPMQ